MSAPPRTDDPVGSSTSSSAARGVPAIAAELATLRVSGVDVPPPYPPTPPPSSVPSVSSSLPELSAAIEVPAFAADLSVIRALPPPPSTAPRTALTAPAPPRDADSAQQDCDVDEWKESSEVSALAVEYPHVSNVVLVPTLRVGSQTMSVNRKLPGLLYSLLKQLLQNTRVWIKDEVVAWLKRDDASVTCRLFVILGDAGTGKSCLASFRSELYYNFSGKLPAEK